MKRLTLFVSTMIISVLLLAITPVFAGEVPPLRTTTARGTELEFGQTKDFLEAGVSLTFDSLVEDSRCPIKAVCFWEGAVEISLSVDFLGKMDGQSVRLRLPAKNRVELENGSSITLTAVNPHPVLGSTIPLEDYSATIVVTPGGTWD
jgi:hypothetical protein